MPSPEQIRSVIDAYVDAYRRDDKQAVLDLFGPDAVWHDPVGEPPHVGLEGIGAFWDTAHAMADSIVLEPRHVVATGGEGAGEGAMAFEIHVGTPGGTMIIDAVEIFTVDDDGKITLLKAYWDMSQARPGQ
jgi:steroid delta-isomerase